MSSSVARTNRRVRESSSAIDRKGTTLRPPGFLAPGPFTKCKNLASCLFAATGEWKYTCPGSPGRLGGKTYLSSKKGD
jgi:hypothetical protein